MGFSDTEKKWMIPSAIYVAAMWLLYFAGEQEVGKFLAGVLGMSILSFLLSLLLLAPAYMSIYKVVFKDDPTDNSVMYFVLVCVVMANIYPYL